MDPDLRSDDEFATERRHRPVARFAHGCLLAVLRLSLRGSLVGALVAPFLYGLVSGDGVSWSDPPDGFVVLVIVGVAVAMVLVGHVLWLRTLPDRQFARPVDDALPGPVTSLPHETVHFTGPSPRPPASPPLRRAGLR